MKRLWIGVLVAAVGFGCSARAEDEGPAAGKDVGQEGAARAALEPGAVLAVERAPAEAAPDPCHAAETTSSPNRPNWTTGAATTQCGVVEFDFGWLWQPMGGGVAQELLPASVRYGVTPRLQLRWGLPMGMTQSGGGTPALSGVSDQWLSGTYRFEEQGPRVPALAFAYGFKIPTANPAKGFGTGYVDHQLTLILSRDVRSLHIDFNTVGTLAGSATGYEGAAQCGLALSVPVTKRLTGIVESDGGSQPGTPDRFGQALAGVSWGLRPSLVLDAGYTRAYTAGVPRQELTFGWTWSSRPKVVATARDGVARLVGR